MHEHDGSSSSKTLTKLLDGFGKCCVGVVLPIVGIDVGVDDVVAELTKNAQRNVVGAEVRGSHVSWELSGNVNQLIFELGHLGLDSGRIDSGHVRMTITVRVSVDPSAYLHIDVRVGANLVAILEHAGNSRAIILDIAPVLSVDEEGSLHASRQKLVKQVLGVCERAIVESKGNGIGLGAALDDGANGQGRAA